MGCIVALDTDRNVRTMLSQSLVARGHHVAGVESTDEAIRALRSLKVDLMVLDLRTGLGSGPEAFKTVIALAKIGGIPLLVLTYPWDSVQKASVDKDLAGLERFEFLAKPFSVEAVDALVSGFLKGESLPTRKVQSRLLAIGEVSVDMDSSRVVGKGGEARLTSTELDILRCLLEHKGQVVPSEQIFHFVWGESAGGNGPELVRWHLKNLRAKLNQSAGQTVAVIQTVPGRGYTIAGGQKGQSQTFEQA